AAAGAAGAGARHVHALDERQARPALPLGDVFALEPLHRDVGLPVVELSERDDLHDRRVPEPREHATLALEPRLFAGVDAGQGDHFERDRLAGHFIARAVDDADAAATDLALDDEPPRQGLGGERRRHARFFAPTAKIS